MAIDAITIKIELINLLNSVPPSEAIGVAMAFILDCAEKNPGQLQHVLHAQVERRVINRVQKAEIIDILNTVARGH